MKKKAFLSAVCLALLCAVLTLSGCIFIKMDIKYYGNDDNYAVQSGEVESIMYRDESLRLSFVDGYTLYIVEANEKVLRGNDFYVDVRIGSKIKFTAGKMRSADRTDYIVAIEYNGKTYLDFETGKNNLLEYLRGLL